MLHVGNKEIQKILRESVINKNSFLEKRLTTDYIIIGDTIRKKLYKKFFKANLVDSIGNPHLDILIKIGNKGDIEKVKSKIKKELTFVKRRFCLKGNLNGENIEIVGFIDKKRNLYNINGDLENERPDASIERIGIDNNLVLYDEFKTGFNDFLEKRIRINPRAKSNSLWFGKLIKLISLKFQLNFHFTRESLNLINKFLNKVSTTSRLNKFYGPDKPSALRNYLKVLYLRTDTKKEVTDYLISLHKNILKIFQKLNIDLHKFEKIKRL